MLPFLKNKQKSAGIVQVLERPSDKPENEQQEDNYNEDLEICAMDILKAIKTNDIKLLASSIKAAFEICDAQPHVEGEHLEET